jgi:hypothetical protein
MSWSGNATRDRTHRLLWGRIEIQKIEWPTSLETNCVDQSGASIRWPTFLLIAQEAGPNFLHTLSRRQWPT